MSFNTIEYFVFLWVAVGIYHGTPARWRSVSLLAICYIFYALWSVYFALYLLLATVIAYKLANGSKKTDLSLGLIFFIGSFIFFKGLPFWRDSFNLWKHVVVPVGLSYYTFRLMSYMIDVHWEKIKPQKDLVSFATYAAFFPHILSGPIQRAEEYFPQIDQSKVADPSLWSSGMRLILCGLFKKLVVADNLAVVVDNVFGHASMYNTTALWVATYVFYLQIFADFSGLTDIAIGSGRLFGIDSPPNFNAPYLAKNIQDFWRRWHMTLCRWINDYLFLPLRMALRNWGVAGMVLSVFVNMAAISLWHGTTTGFIAFGLIQGVLICVSTFTLKSRDLFFKEHPSLQGVRRFFGPLITFHLVAFSFIFFRCSSAGEAMQFISRLFSGVPQWSGLGMGLGAKAIMGCVLALIAAEWFEHSIKDDNRRGFGVWPVWARWGSYYGMVMALLLFGRFWPKEFIYFKF